MNVPGDSAEWLREHADQVEALADSDHDFAAAARVLLAIQREEDPDPDDLAETRETVKPFIDTDGTAEQYVRARAVGRDHEVSPGERRAFAAAVRDAIRREERAERAPVDVQMRVETRENADGDPVQVTVWEVAE